MAAPLWRPLRAPAYEQQLRRLFDLFDEGDLDEALRWAIPLDKDGKPSGAAPGWELPKPRDRFDIVGRPAGGRFGLGLATEPFMELRQRYERAHERLLAQGRIDDAAFVLAELLREPGRAVDLLEKEKRWEQAAKVAVAAELPPERIVRLWMRAGDLPRALLWARRTGAFGAALAALTKDQPEEARILRQAWARHFAERGDFAGATTVAWEDPRLRAEAVPWLGAALASGTPAGAALLARVLRQDAATYAMVADRLEGLLAVPGLEGIRLRQALGRGLAAEGGAHGRRLLRPVVRALLGDLSRTPELVDVGWLRGVVPMVDDRALARDVPTLSAARQTLIGRPQPIRVEVAAGDVGTAEVYDLAWLPNGGVLVALGELGCRSYAADGRVRARFDVAATALVPLAGSTRSLALALRAWGVRVSRLDVADASVNEWLDRPLTAWSTAADGNQWFVAEASHVLALDLLANPPQALWRVECDGPVHRITAGEQALAILADAGEERERWRYRLPDLRLLERLRSGPPDSGREALLASGALLQLRGGRPGQALSMVTTAERPVDERVSILLGDDQTGEAAQAPHACGEWRAWVRSYAYGARVHLAHASVHTVVLTVHLAGARRVVLRLDAAVLAIGDDRGRVLVFDLETGVCLRDLRVG